MKHFVTPDLLLVVPLLVVPTLGCASSGRAQSARIGALGLTAELFPEGSAEEGRIGIESLVDEVVIEAFEAVLYEDLDGNAALGEGEARKTTLGVTPVPTGFVDAVAFTLPAGMTSPRLRVVAKTNRGPTAMDLFVIVPGEE